MEKIKLRIIGVLNGQSRRNTSMLLLGEEGGNQQLPPIVIGEFEANSIVMELENLESIRPLTHDLFKNFITIFNITITEVIITHYSEGTFYAKLICSDGISIVEVDSRVSDAVALALRFNCPIYTNKKLFLEEEMMTAEQDDENQVESFAKYSLSELENQINDAIEAEDYERASIIQTEINKRLGKI